MEDSNRHEGSVRTHRLSEAVFVIRRRRAMDGADVLLDECLALLDAIADQSPLQRVVVARAGTIRRSARIAPACEDSLPELDGSSPAIERLKKDIACVAHDAHVAALILGESGTGKERVARAIHRLSPRAGFPFVVVNCAGLSPAFADDDLFGHVRGAFTGAVTDRAGPFERANGGTVFLDDVGELTADSQAKLLHVLQRQAVQRLGSGRETPLDVRVIAAASADLGVAQRRGRLRQDLYYRLKVYELRVPPLRRRGAADLRRLVDAIVTHLSARRRRPLATLAPDSWELLTRYSWPGNVRELENTLERMLVAAGDELVLTPAHMPDDVRGSVDAMARPAPGSAPAGPARMTMAPARPSAIEALAALERNDFKYGRTALELGMSRHQLYRLLRRCAVPEVPADRALA